MAVSAAVARHRLAQKESCSQTPVALRCIRETYRPEPTPRDTQYWGWWDKRGSFVVASH